MADPGQGLTPTERLILGGCLLAATVLIAIAGAAIYFVATLYSPWS